MARRHITPKPIQESAFSPSRPSGDRIRRQVGHPRHPPDPAGFARMEAASIAAAPPAGTADGAAPGDKGLKTDALGFVSNLVIGVASTAPGYSLAASLGLVVA